MSLEEIVTFLNYDIPVIEIPYKNIIFMLLTIIIGYFVTILISRAVKKAMLRAKMSEILAEFSRRIIKYFLLIFIVAFSIGFLGIDALGGILGLSVVSGFVLGFALKDTLGNLAAGFMLAVTKPFKKGDYVEIAGHEGSINNVGISITTMTTVDNKRIIIPNGQVYGTSMVNYTALKQRRIDMQVGIGYSDDIGKATKVALDVITKHKMVLKDPSPTIAVGNLGDSSVDLLVRPWVNTSDYWDAKFELTQQIKEAFDKNGINIPFPQRDVHLYQNK
jgi:small conductance mechanosensitive channel